MSLLFRTRRRLADSILRGSLLELWVNRKMRRLERAYATELVKESRGEAAIVSTRLNLRRQPRRILFISDVQWEAKELVPELRKIGTVDTLNLQPHLSDPANRRTAPDRIVAAALRKHLSGQATEPDVVLFYARPALLSEEAFELIRKSCSCPLLGMNLDDKVQFLDFGLFSDRNDNYRKWARYFDLNITNVCAVVDWYADSDLPVYYMAEGYHPKTEAPRGQPTYRHELAFVGSWRSERAQLCRHLQSLGVRLEAFGFGWPKAEEGRVPETIYRSSMIVLGIGFASPSKSLTTLKTRDFECPGSGACYLTTYNWELALHYELGKEILCYRSVDEIVELYSYYRRRPEECWKIAQAAYRRCLNEHTWERRFRKLFEETGLGA